MAGVFKRITAKSITRHTAHKEYDLTFSTYGGSGNEISASFDGVTAYGFVHTWRQYSGGNYMEYSSSAQATQNLNRHLGTSSIGEYDAHSAIRGRFFKEAFSPGDQCVKHNHHDTLVLGLPHLMIGDGIKPGSIEIQNDGGSATWRDDGKGLIYREQMGTSGYIFSASADFREFQLYQYGDHIKGKYDKAVINNINSAPLQTIQGELYNCDTNSYTKYVDDPDLYVDKNSQSDIIAYSYRFSGSRGPEISSSAHYELIQYDPDAVDPTAPIGFQGNLPDGTPYIIGENESSYGYLRNIPIGCFPSTPDTFTGLTISCRFRHKQSYAMNNEGGNKFRTIWALGPSSNPNQSGSAEQFSASAAVQPFHQAATLVQFNTTAVEQANCTLQLRSTDGSVRTYVSDGSATGTLNGSGHVGFFGNSATPAIKAQNLKAAIESANGHNGELVCNLLTISATNDTVFIYQKIPGADGNTVTVEGVGFASAIVGSSVGDFSGGQDYEDPITTPGNSLRLMYAPIQDMMTGITTECAFILQSKYNGVVKSQQLFLGVDSSDVVQTVVTMAPGGLPRLYLKNMTNSSAGVSPSNGSATCNFGTDWEHNVTTYLPEHRFITIGAGHYIEQQGYNPVTGQTGTAKHIHSQAGMALLDFQVYSTGSLTMGNQLQLNRQYEAGRVFYEDGIIVLQKDNDPTDWLRMKLGFKNTVVREENEYVCMVQDHEFNMSQNPSLLQSGSSIDSPIIKDIVSSGDWDPYITTIGLYNDVNELLAIGKLGRPIRKVEHYDQTFIVRWDK